MIIYWLLFAFPALMALGYPVAGERLRADAAQALALLAFVLAYALLAGLRHETGGDWNTYDIIFEDIRTDTLGYALTATDPLFGFINWVSAQLGTGVYMVNAVCAWVLGYGVVKVAVRLRDPWLAILMAVPYLLIVVGLGYVRQSAAIGMVLIAIASFDQSRPVRTVFYLLVAMAFHSTAVVAFPLFAYALTSRYKILAVLFALIGALAFVTVLAPRLETFEAGYLDAEYESGGALTRLVMSLVPSALLLLRWKHFGASERVRSVWVLIAVANFLCLAALILTPSSTAVDRIALFFSVAQMGVMGEFRDLVPLPDRFAVAVRLILIGVAASVQVVWLVFATHAEYWVPYESVLQFL